MAAAGRSALAAVKAEAARCAYAVFLVHGLFLAGDGRVPLPDHAAARTVVVVAASLGVAQLATLLLSPDAARLACGVHPSPGDRHRATA